MSRSGWPHLTSPFHEGELAIQTRLGVRDQMERQGRRIIRDYLTDQHRKFFQQLSYVIAGTVDGEGHPWASIVVGQPGFLSVPDARTLRVTSSFLQSDPLATTLAEGADIGFLGIELHTRRRNRINGVVTAVHPGGFDVQVVQTFGNCPQYIQARTFEWIDGEWSGSEGSSGEGSEDASTTSKRQAQLPAVREFERFGETETSAIAAADTFFIATAYQDRAAGLASGVDVSHRGGKSGFVRVDDHRTLTVPDYSGNNHFNTFGNIELNPRAGLLFVDFVQGHLLYLTGTAEVIWDGPDIRSFLGAERLLRFQLKQGYEVQKELLLRWSQPEYSPYLEFTNFR
ncbi:MAG: pyridoxamine 5'-phosphate oxidase family protein [Cyanobacteria bacterium P01_A01_bin.3]